PPGSTLFPYTTLFRSSLAAPLKRSGLFPALFTQMVAVGERSGELEGLLTRAAEAYDEEVAAALARLTSLLEPLTILVMGGVVLLDRKSTRLNSSHRTI